MDLWDLHVALSCTLPLCPTKIKSFCLDFKARYDAAIDWYPLPPAILSIVDHFHEVIEVFPPTIRSGMLRYYSYCSQCSAVDSFLNPGVFVVLAKLR